MLCCWLAYWCFCLILALPGPAWCGFSLLPVWALNSSCHHKVKSALYASSDAGKIFWSESTGSAEQWHWEFQNWEQLPMPCLMWLLPAATLGSEESKRSCYHKVKSDDQQYKLVHAATACQWFRKDFLCFRTESTSSEYYYTYSTTDKTEPSSCVTKMWWLEGGGQEIPVIVLMVVWFTLRVSI